MNKKVTIKEVASAAGVSAAVVSAVLNGKTDKIRVSDEKRKLVLDAADRLGYVPDISAQKLKTGDNHLIATFTYENIFPVESKTEFYDFFVGVQEEAERQGYDLIILNNWGRDTDRTARLKIASGAVMIGVNRDQGHISSLVRQQFPLVFIGRRDIGVNLPLNCVLFDYKKGIERIIGSLKPLIRPDGILFVHNDDSTEHSVDKFAYITDICQREDIRLRTMTYMTGAESEIIKNIEPGGTIIFDRLYMIPSFAPLLENEGLIPGKTIFGGVLEDDWMGLNHDWTSWANRRRDLGALAVRLLISKLRGDDSTLENIVDLDLVERSSSLKS